MNKKLKNNVRKYLLIAGGMITLSLLTTLADTNSVQKNLIENTTIEQDYTLKSENSVTEDKRFETANPIETDISLKNEEHPNEINKDIIDEIDKLVIRYYDTSNAIDEKILTNNQEVEKEEIVELISKKREGIEAYENIETYVKPGIENNSYVVFSTYHMKIHNIETLAPGMSVINIIYNDGKYTIKNDPSDVKLNEYISQLSQDDEIKKIIVKVNLDLAKALEQDKTLKTFIEDLKDVSE